MTLKKFLPDLLAFLLLVAAALWYAANFVDFSIPPFEDAAMLMRYAQHLAEGRGIVWNIGQPPIDGATDFLFMAAAAALIKLGLTVGQAVRGLGFAAHILTALLIYWANRRIHASGVVSAWMSAAYLMVGTGFSYVSAYFGTPFFALFAALTWTLALVLMRRSDAPLSLSLAFAFSGLVTGLIRPEGALLAGLMLLAVVWMRGWKNSLSVVIAFGAVFFTLGGAYFLWRWNYFGYPLPNPFYKKSGAALHWDSFNHSLLNALRLCFPMAFAFLFALRSKETTRRALAYLIPIVGFAAAFILISDEMNYGARFQYALLPIALLSWIPLAGEINLPTLNRSARREDAARFLLLAALGASLLFYSQRQNCFLTSYQQTCARPYENDGRYEMAKILAEYRGKGYIMATTEAGLLPYYSGWTAIDAWGLNDSFIAHHGGLTGEYLDQYQPHVIMFHDYYSPLVPPKLTEPNLAQPWFRMTITMKQYAETHGYILAAVFGDSPYNTHYYYVRADFEDSKRLAEQISKMKNYYWVETGKKSINYANYQQP
ncbi:MAG: hypothetical protein Fur002_19660 [Anaerolineales bacterium]